VGNYRVKKLDVYDGIWEHMELINHEKW